MSDDNVTEVTALPGDLIRQLTEKRKTIRLTQEALAADIGVSCSSLRRWEKRKCDPSLGAACAWAEVLGFRLALSDTYEPIERWKPSQQRSSHARHARVSRYA